MAFWEARRTNAWVRLVFEGNEPQFSFGDSSRQEKVCCSYADLERLMVGDALSLHGRTMRCLVERVDSVITFTLRHGSETRGLVVPAQEFQMHLDQLDWARLPDRYFS